MHLDPTGIITYLSALAAALSVLLGAVYKMGKISRTFDTHVLKIKEWEGALQNLNSIPDIKTGMIALAEKITRIEEKAEARFMRHDSHISDLKTKVARLEGRVSITTEGT